VQLVAGLIRAVKEVNEQGPLLDTSEWDV